MPISKFSMLTCQYECIRRFFKNTTEPCDDLQWNGRVLDVWSNGEKVATYTYADLVNIGVLCCK